jgi:N6-adenosine-specific RNA methylase IME4
MGPLIDHEIAAIFPLLPEPELKALAEDIKQNGQREPIMLYEGKILDGRNRYRACQMAGVEPQVNYYHEKKPLQYVVSLNLHRRHLNESQRGMIAAKLANAPEGRPKKNSPNLGSISVAQAAEMLNVSHGTIDTAKSILRDAPEQAAAIERGEKTVSEVKRELNKAKLTSQAKELPKDVYRIVYADPPWKYGDTMAATLDQSYGGAEKHYPTMSIDRLCWMPVSSMVADNAVLFLWTTSPLLEDSFRVVNAWGFKYKTSFVWDKVRHNMGHYNSVRHEFLLVCTRGSCTPDVNKLFDSVQSIERTGKHSEKPEEFRKIIDTLYPNGPRVELFRRGAAPEGWQVWGNEVTQ